MAKGTKKRILDESLHIIFEKGFSAFRLEDVSCSLNISRKTIYNNFKNREKLLAAVFEHYSQKFSEALDELSERTDLEYVEKIEIAANIVSEEFTKLNNLKINEHQFFRDNSITAPLAALKQRLHKWIGGVIEEGIKSGFLRKDSSLRILPYYFVNLIEGASKIAVSKETCLSKNNYIKEALRISLRGVLTEEAAAGL